MNSRSKTQIKYDITFIEEMIKTTPYKQDQPVLKKQLAQLKKELKDTDIFAYFAETFGQAPDDDTLMDLPVNSPCGIECRRVIDLGARLWRKVDLSVKSDVIQTIEHGVSVFWRG